jgi:nucleolar pre-ribosomal-associated protein 1
LADDRQSKSVDMPYPVQHIQDIVDCIIHHPIIALSLSHSLSNCNNLSYGSLEYLEEALAIFSKENLHLLDHFVIKLLGKSYDLY